MDHHRRSRSLAPAALTLLFLLAPASARAEVEVGADAPQVESPGFVNTEPVSLTDLKGRVVLLELWKTT